MTELLTGATLWELVAFPILLIFLVWCALRVYRAWRYRQNIRRRLAEIANMETKPHHGWNDIQRYRKD